MDNPILYSLAYRHQYDVFHNFAKQEDDMNFPSLSHMLPSKELVETYVEDKLLGAYEIVEVHLVSYRDGVIHVQYADPQCWICEEEDDSDE